MQENQEVSSNNRLLLENKMLSVIKEPARLHFAEKRHQTIRRRNGNFNSEFVILFNLFNGNLYKDNFSRYLQYFSSCKIESLYFLYFLILSFRNFPKS